MKSPYEIEQTTFALRLLLSRGAHGFDILHTQDPHLARILDTCHRRGLFPPRVLLAHGTEEPPEYLAGFSYLQHLAPQHAEEIATFQKPGTKWFVGPNFVDTARFHPGQNAALRSQLGIAPDAFVVITSAAVKRHHKRIDYLIEEFARFENDYSGDAHLLIVGASTDDTEMLREQALQKGGERIHFLVDQPHEQMPDILRAGDLFVLCSLKEMMPIALLEALATGLPVLVSEHPVVSWMRGPGGASVAMAENGALAAALAAWSDCERRRGAGERARQHAEEQFSEHAAVDTLNRIYAKALEGE
jgi:1,2-diacylglycerol 3-alpha-glucosyltransferase